MYFKVTIQLTAVTLTV